MTKKKVLKKGEVLNKGGRPTVYKKEYNELAYKFCLLGADDKVLAGYFDVDARTINRWKNDHPKFCQSLKDGKEIADANVGKALYERACGYSHVDTKFATHEGKITDREEYTKHYPPDTAAAFIWLRNRAGWVDKSTVDQNIKLVPEINLNNPNKNDLE